jgi:hypothetical protein
MLNQSLKTESNYPSKYIYSGRQNNFLDVNEALSNNGSDSDDFLDKLNNSSNEKAEEVPIGELIGNRAIKKSRSVSRNSVSSQ